MIHSGRGGGEGGKTEVRCVDNAGFSVPPIPVRRFHQLLHVAETGDRDCGETWDVIAKLPLTDLQPNLQCN